MGSCCSAATADCCPTSTSCCGEKRLNPALIFVCASASPTLMMSASTAAHVLIRFMKSPLLFVFVSCVIPSAVEREGSPTTRNPLAVYAARDDTLHCTRDAV